VRVRKRAMTESEWLTATDPQTILTFLQDRGHLSPRKARLFAAACVRLHWDLLIEPPSRNAVGMSEGVADGTSPPEALTAAYQAAWGMLPRLPDRMAIISAARAAARTVQRNPLHAAEWTKNEVVELEAELAMERAGSEADEDRLYWEGKAAGGQRLAQLLRDLFGPLPFRNVPLDPAWLVWNEDVIGKLAASIYEGRTFERMPILGDALEEAGCGNEEMLTHCRQQGLVHVRGCWLLDLLLRPHEAG
jgi:hypothetical protein